LLVYLLKFIFLIFIEKSNLDAMRRSSRIAAAQAKAAEEAPAATLPVPAPKKAKKAPRPPPTRKPKKKSSPPSLIPASSEEPASESEPSAEEPSSEELSSDEEFSPRKERRAQTQHTRPQQPVSKQQISYDLEPLAESGTVNLNGRITVTRAKSEYQVHDNDIKHLEFIRCPNPHLERVPDAYWSTFLQNRCILQE
jgi:hypothetical protein